VGDEERDPFGMPIAAPAAATPAGIAAPLTPTPAPRSAAGPAAPPRRLPFAAAFTALALIALGVMLWQTDRRELDSPAVIGRELGGHALGPRSLVRAPGFAAALAQVRADLRPGERLVGLRLTPLELNTRIRDAHGALRLVDVDVAGKRQSTSWSTDTNSTPIAFSAIDPAVPQRIVAAALRAAHAGDTHLEDVSLNGVSDGAATWSVQLEDVDLADRSWTADLAGVAVTHPGALPAASGLSGRSLLVAANLRTALARVARAGTQLEALRIQPDQLTATVRTVGRRRTVQVDAAQRATVRDDTAGAADARAMAVARIDPLAPQRAVAAVLRRADATPAHIDSVMLQFLPTAGGGVGYTASWLVLLDDRVPVARRQWRAGLDGRGARQL
jgi:hypothetical protein